MKTLYAGIDLHGNNNYLAVVGGDGRRVFDKRLSNDMGWIREALHPYKEELVGIAVESTYNWYFNIHIQLFLGMGRPASCEKSC